VEDLLLGVLLVIEFISGRFKDEEEDNEDLYSFESFFSIADLS